ncbi:MAG: ubiquitin-like protein UBact [Nitrospinota bacterium]|nr:ubiquitin-like protein UBact [Nitrospinota bacterium]
MNDPLRREEKKESTPDRKDSGPSKPDVNRPGRDDLLKRMKKVDPKQSEKYKQRTGQ